MISIEDSFFIDCNTLIKKDPRVLVRYNPVVVNPNASLMQQIINTPPPGWEHVFNKHRKSLELVCSILNRPENIDHYPKTPDIFAAFHLCPPENVKVIILGGTPLSNTFEDGVTEATGIAFSGRKLRRMHPTTRVIFEELNRQIPTLRPQIDGDLSNWLKQGVFMLDTCLTSHPSRGKVRFWTGFLIAIIEELLNVYPDMILVMWGSEAQDFVSNNLVKQAQNARILQCGYPSSYSGGPTGFKFSNHFAEINNILTERGEYPIDFNTH